MKPGSDNPSSLVREWATVTFGYVALTVLMTYPIAFGLSRHFMGDGYDGFQNTWNFWWFRKALTEWRNPFFTDYQFHPTGVTLVFHTLNLFNAALSLPLQAVCNMETTYNVIALFTFAASGLAMYALVRHLLRHRGAAFVAGLIYAFCPYRMGHALGHLNLLSTEFIPLFVLFFLRTSEGGGKRDVLLATLTLTLCWFCSEYYILYSLTFAAVYLVVQRMRRDGPVSIDGVKRVAISVTLFLLVIAPLWVQMFVVKSRENFDYFHDPHKWSADLLSFFVPGQISSYGALFKPIWSTFSGSGRTAEDSMYCGYVALGLALFAWYTQRAARVWWWMTLVFFVLALGPQLRVGGMALPVPLPYALVHRLPLVSLSGVPERFDIMVMLCLAISASFTVKHVAERASNPQLARLRVACAALAMALEYAAAPYPAVTLRVPAFYRQLAHEPGDFALIDTPFSAPTMYLQTIHGKRLVDGYISRAPRRARAFVRDNPAVGFLCMEDGAREPRGEAALAQARLVLRRNNIRYVVAHTGSVRPFLERIRAPVVFSGDGIRVYRTD